MDEHRTVLIVDDTIENIDVLKGILQEKYIIKVATSGELALKIAESNSPPDIILLDVMMPGMDGYEVCEILKKNIRTKRIPIIFVTAKGDASDEMHGFELGAVDYITKPVNPAIVEARVHTHLALYNQKCLLESEVKIRTAEIEETRLQIVQRLGLAAEYKDNETGMHVLRMSHFSKIIGLKYGLLENEAELLFNSAPMHDIGKIGIPDDVLLKPGKLDTHEWQEMMKHPEIGARIIGDHPSILLESAKQLALTHHEKWDGTGYPEGISGEDIPPLGRIVAIADVFDALTSDRPYKNAWPIDKATELISNEKGKHFEPKCVEAFFDSLPEILKIKDQFRD